MKILLIAVIVLTVVAIGCSKSDPMHGITSPPPVVRVEVVKPQSSSASAEVTQTLVVQQATLPTKTYAEQPHIVSLAHMMRDLHCNTDAGVSSITVPTEDGGMVSLDVVADGRILVRPIEAPEGSGVTVRHTDC